MKLMIFPYIWGEGSRCIGICVRIFYNGFLIAINVPSTTIPQQCLNDLTRAKLVYALPLAGRPRKLHVLSECVSAALVHASDMASASLAARLRAFTFSIAALCFMRSSSASPHFSFSRCRRIHTFHRRHANLNDGHAIGTRGLVSVSEEELPELEYMHDGHAKDDTHMHTRTHAHTHTHTQTYTLIMSIHTGNKTVIVCLNQPLRLRRRGRQVPSSKSL